MGTKQPSARTAVARRYQSPNIPMAAIRRFARQIAEHFQPDKIVLFGSYAYGTPHADSDVDILVIMPAWDVVAKAIRIRRTIRRPFPLDLIVRTPGQIRRGLADANWFLREIVGQGKVLYEKSGGEVGSQSRSRLRRRAPTSVNKPAVARPGLLPLSAKCGKVPEGALAKPRPRRSARP